MRGETFKPTMHWRLCLPLVMLGLAVGPRLADACQDRVHPPVISAKEVAAYQHIYVVHVTKIVSGQRDSRYAPPFSFTGRVLRRLKGSVRRGRVVRGRTSKQRFRSECPVRLRRGKTYLLLLNGKRRALVLQRFGTRHWDSRAPTFKAAVARIQALINGHP